MRRTGGRGLPLVLGLWSEALFHAAAPTYAASRQAAIQEFLGYVSKGTEKDYEKAFNIVSFRVRITNNPNEYNFYRTAYEKMHNELAEKHGKDWLAKATIKYEDLADFNEDEEVEYVVHIDDVAYHISTQVQISPEEAISNLTTKFRKKYPEDGKYHFGIMEVAEYPAHPRPLIHNRPEPQLGPGQRTDNFGGRL